MGKRTPQAPTPPDPNQLAAAQAAYSMPSQFTPFGSLTYGSGGQQGGMQGSVFSNIFDAPAPSGPDMSGLSPEQQSFLAAHGPDGIRAGSQGGGQGVAGPSGAGAITSNIQLDPAVQSLLDQQLDMAGQGATDFSQAFYDRTSNLLNPQFQQQEERLRQSLADRGLPGGSEAFEDELGLLMRNQNLARNQLALDSTLAGGQEQSRQFGQLGSLVNQAMGSFSQPGGVDVLGANAMSQAGQQNAFNQAMGQQNAKKSGATQLGSAGIFGALASSASFKHELGEAEAIDSDDLVDRVGNLLLRVQKITGSGDMLDKLKSIPVKTWRYIWDDKKHVGPYAEDVQRILGIGNGKAIPVGEFLLAMKRGMEESHAH